MSAVDKGEWIATASVDALDKRTSFTTARN